MTPTEKKLIKGILVDTKHIFKNIFRVLWNLVLIVGMIVISPITWILSKFSYNKKKDIK